jgi:hypothetical protein
MKLGRKKEDFLVVFLGTNNFQGDFDFLVIPFKLFY